MRTASQDTAASLLGEAAPGYVCTASTLGRFPRPERWLSSWWAPLADSHGEVGDQFRKFELAQRLGSREACLLVPTHRSVVVALHDRPRLIRMAARCAAVPRVADIAWARLF